MKKLISIIIVLLALVSLTHCKLAEVEAIEEIPCPEIGIDSSLFRRGTWKQNRRYILLSKISKYIRNGPF